jgi:hypothetical protein
LCQVHSEVAQAEDVAKRPFDSPREH